MAKIRKNNEQEKINKIKCRDAISKTIFFLYCIFNVAFTDGYMLLALKYYIYIQCTIYFLCHLIPYHRFSVVRAHLSWKIYISISIIYTCLRIWEYIYTHNHVYNTLSYFRVLCSVLYIRAFHGITVFQTEWSYESIGRNSDERKDVKKVGRNSGEKKIRLTDSSKIHKKLRYLYSIKIKSNAS